MALIIDGYNLLNASDVFPTQHCPPALQRSRRALLDFLAEHLAPHERRATQVVFDAKHRPRGTAASCRYRGLTVRYASGYDEADDLIEELIQADSAPRKLTVVSSDHRVQRAARRRRARAVDSDVWLRQLVAAKRQCRGVDNTTEDKPDEPLSEAEVAEWVALFGDAGAEWQRTESETKL